LAEFLVEEFIASAPVNFGMDFWEEELHEVLEVGFQNVFPGAIVGVAGFGHGALLNRFFLV
jgi:hypothetical protein